MSKDETPRLGLPVLQIGQSAREMTHNEALALIDMALAAAVEDVGRVMPPADPVEGQCWIVGAAPTGAWAGHADAIAGWTVGGWRFVAATPGLSAWCIARGHQVVFHDGWEDGVVRGTRVLVGGEQVVGARQPAIPAPQNGATIDAEARAALGAILDALRTHGLVA